MLLGGCWLVLKDLLTVELSVLGFETSQNIVRFVAGEVHTLQYNILEKTISVLTTSHNQVINDGRR